MDGTKQFKVQEVSAEAPDGTRRFSVIDLRNAAQPDQAHDDQVRFISVSSPPLLQQCTLLQYDAKAKAALKAMSEGAVFISFRQYRNEAVRCSPIWTSPHFVLLNVRLDFC